MLKFGKANKKHDNLTTEDMVRIGAIHNEVFNGKLPNLNKLVTFSLPAGYTCPGALNCQTWANRETGKITDGENLEFRCYAASQEALYPSLRDSRWCNFDQLKNLCAREVCDLLEASFPKNAEICRIHVSGDFFSVDYLAGWFMFAAKRPNVLFYAYTKSLKILEFVRQDLIQPRNLEIVASRGGKFDERIRDLDLRAASVVFADKGEAVVDHSDVEAIAGGTDFDLILHGTQPKGSDAAEALKVLRRNA